MTFHPEYTAKLPPVVNSLLLDFEKTGNEASYDEAEEWANKLGITFKRLNLITEIIILTSGKVFGAFVAKLA